LERTDVGFEVRVDQLSKRYQVGEQKVVALDNLTFSIAPGLALAVTGPSGSGKSTLLHVIGAMDAPDSGTVNVDGLLVTSLKPREQPEFRRRIGFVFQRFHLIPALTVLDNVLAPLVPFGVRAAEVQQARKLLAAVGLVGREEFMPARLSGGEQQRVAIARALINDPGLLLADEPTGNLDSATTQEIVQLLSDIRADRDMTLIVATHDPVVATTCDRIVGLQSGRMVEDVSLIPGDHQDTMDRVLRLDVPD
jgi:putative ABC transport system ATP-binding protein